MLYDKLLLELQDYISPMQVNGNVLAVLDCLIAFANNALLYNYHKPEIYDGTGINTERKPSPRYRKEPSRWRYLYITNDIHLDPSSQQIIILTGPNMSGKSAVLRQTALITLMAHMGSFVPATNAKIPITDKIFTRLAQVIT